MKTLLSFAVPAVVAMSVSSSASAYLRITEVMSASGSGGTNDWLEVTNYGTSAVSFTGYRMDDNSFSFGASVELLGVASIAAGESVVFFETFWGGLSGVQVGYYNGSGAGVSFSSGGDGAVVFNSTGTQVTQQATFGAATTGSSFYFDLPNNNTGIVSVVGTIGTQVTFQAGTPVNTGSLGTAIGIPAPGAVALLGVAGLVGGRRRR
jgi:hypothetical protein